MFVSRFSSTDRCKRKPALTDAQQLMYSQEKSVNFRLVSRMVARYAPTRLGEGDLAPKEVQDYLAEIGEFAQLAQLTSSIDFIFSHIPTLCEPGFPLEGYTALPYARVARVFVGKTAAFPGILAFRFSKLNGTRRQQKQIVLAFSGTTNAHQALLNLWAVHHPHASQRGTVHRGFWALYEGIRASALDAIRAALSMEEAITRTPTGRNTISEVVVTGHSMGAAVAQLLVLDLLRDDSDMQSLIGGIPLRFVGFGGPRVGDAALRALWCELVVARRARYGEDAFGEYAIKMYNDGVPALPPLAFGYRHLVQSAYYAENDKLYRVPPELGEYSRFRTLCHDATVPVLHPRGGHMYYNGRDAEGMVRRLGWFKEALKDEPGVRAAYLTKVEQDAAKAASC
ncbi:Triacylglycerol lipase [Mycena kentingensis (nom. inval.)]|nr:Triacylglycerol lipase [Mycena kentingensis (nom. inval.)]